METATRSPEVPVQPHPAQKLYRDTDGHAWVGEYWVGRRPQNAVLEADIPAATDPRWVHGVPSVLDVEVLTLSPFFPSGRLGACVERKGSKRDYSLSNHPPFDGCTAWMPIDMVDWKPCTGRVF